MIGAEDFVNHVDEPLLKTNFRLSGETRYRVLAVCSHPVQYMAPVLRQMARHPQLDLSVAYCELKGAQAAYDAEFGRTVQWDVPLLEGYSWQEVQRKGRDNRFWGLYNPGLRALISKSTFDAVLCFLSYRCASFWVSYLACRRSQTAFIFGTDAIGLTPRNGKAWKGIVKKLLWPQLFSLADQVVVPSSSTRQLMLSIGVPEERITLTPYSVDNDWWCSNSDVVNRQAVRDSWGAGQDTCIVLFCAKLQPWKRPQDVLRAFAKASVPDGLLISRRLEGAATGRTGKRSECSRTRQTRPLSRVC